MPDLIKQITALQQQASQVATLKTKINKLTRQLNEARGRAAEYKSYTTKYQKELAELRRDERARLSS